MGNRIAGDSWSCSGREIVFVRQLALKTIEKGNIVESNDIITRVARSGEATAAEMAEDVVDTNLSGGDELLQSAFSRDTAGGDVQGAPAREIPLVPKISGAAGLHVARGGTTAWEREEDLADLEKIWASLGESPREHIRALTALRRSAPSSIVRLLGDDMESLGKAGLLCRFPGNFYALQAGVRKFTEGLDCRADASDHKKIGLCYKKKYDGEGKTVFAEEAVYHLVEAGEVDAAAHTAGRLADQYREKERSEDALELLNGILSMGPANSESLLISRGRALCDLGRHAESREDFQAADRAMEHRDESGAARSDALKGLADVLIRMDHYNEALTVYRNVLSIQEKAFGTINHPEYAAALHCMAGVQVRLGHYNEAVSSYRESLGIRKKVQGEEVHLEHAASLYGLAGALDKLGAYKEAVATYRKVLTIQGREFGSGEHPDYAATLGGLAASLAHLGLYKEAVQNYQKSLAIQKRVYGTDIHAEYAVSLNGLAGALDRLGSFKEAVDAYKKSLGIQSKAYGTEVHPEYAASLHGLANSLAHQGNCVEAGKTYAQALEIKKEVYGTENHPSVLPTLANWGNTLATIGEVEAACEKLEMAAEIAKKIDIPFHTGNILFLMAQVLRWQDPGRAEKLAMEGKKILKNLLGPDHPLVRQVGSFLSLLEGGIA